ncbi:hypothetical protein SAMN05216532_8050 [Streptomyces sp. 2231.1]|nr:hypothetical protein [Streptomyces sp. 2231.1]SEE39032.1 hypothetical protein SAMN05216532_8050 [Streptomyces sp. 2231.1]
MDLELVLLANAVGCEVLLRRSGHGVQSWEEKPPASGWWPIACAR